MTDRKRIMVYAEEQDFELISKLAEEYRCSKSWLLCHLVRSHVDKERSSVKLGRKELLYDGHR